VAEVGTTKLVGVPVTVVTAPLPKVVERKSKDNGEADMVKALVATDAEIGCICAGALEKPFDCVYQVLFVDLYTKPAVVPANNVVGAPTILCPVFELTVNVLIVCVELNEMVMPSTGAAGIMIVPDASEPAGFIKRTVMPAANVYEKPVIKTW
jgi:hypothetical protein